MAWFYEMPQASPTMEAGTILAWRKAEGDALAPQEVLAEVETDKAAMEIEVFDSGYLLRILAPAGAEVPAGRPIAILGRSLDEDVEPLLARLRAEVPAAPAAPREATAAPAAPPPAPTAPPERAVEVLVPFRWMGKVPDAAIMEPALGYAPAPGPGSRVRAAPAARRAARELNVDLARVSGSGPHGRVMRSDVEAAGRIPTPAAPAASTAVRNSQMRKTIARRLKAAWLDAPVFYLTAAFRCDRLVEFRRQLKDAGVAVSYNDILVKACARALREVPEVNASWGEEAITRHGAVHVGVAVALPDGLVTPVVRDADQKGIASISQEIRALSARAKEQKLQPEEYTGSTFTISNLGMMGIEQFTAILNPPEAVILAVGALQREPVVDEAGTLGVAWTLRVTLTCDHRVVDGALGARFLQALRRLVENPALLAT